MFWVVLEVLICHLKGLIFHFWIPKAVSPVFPGFGAFLTCLVIFLKSYKPFNAKSLLTFFQVSQIYVWLCSGNADFKLAKNIFLPLLWAEILHYLYRPILTNLGGKDLFATVRYSGKAEIFYFQKNFISFLRDNKKNAKKFKTLALLVAILPYAQCFKTTVAWFLMTLKI